VKRKEEREVTTTKTLDQKMKGLSPVLSVLSFIVSILALWHTWLSPFSLTVIPAGRIAFAAHPLVNGKLAAVYVQLVFSNSGAVLGFVDDVSLIVHDGNSHWAVYRSFVDYPDMGVTDRGP
jgi:hypothetical protein